MKSKAYTLEETAKLIKQGKVLVISGSDDLLKQLPDGNWIGGFNPYMIDEHGGKYNTESLLVKDFTDEAANIKIKAYDETDIHKITTDAFENGVIVLIIPFFSAVHLEFALNAPHFENQYMNPLIGWLSGDRPDNTLPGVGTTYVGNKRYTDKGVVLHIELPENKVGRIGIVNVLNPSSESDELRFKEDGFTNTTCIVDGIEKDLYDYLESVNHDYMLPMIADYSGAKIAVGLKKDEANRRALFGAPVYKDNVYRLVSEKPDNYEKEFISALEKEKNSKITYAVSCIFNYFNFGLEGKTIESTVANFTWGEIAYQLLNVTHVYLVIEDRA